MGSSLVVCWVVLFSCLVIFSHTLSLDSSLVHVEFPSHTTTQIYPKFRDGTVYKKNYISIVLQYLAESKKVGSVYQPYYVEYFPPNGFNVKSEQSTVCGSVQASTVSFSYVLSNNATITMIWSVFDGDCVLSFGGATLNATRETIKFSVQLDNYKEYSNETTSIELGSNFLSTETFVRGDIATYYVLNSSVPNYVIDSDSFTLPDMYVVATFPHFVETDSPNYDWYPNITYIDVQDVPVIVNGSILGLNGTWAVPKFPSKLNYDPNFQILLTVENQPSSDGGVVAYPSTSQTKGRAMVIGVSVGVSVFVVIVVALVVVFVVRKKGFLFSETVNSSD